MTTDRYWQAKKVTLVGALVNALLGLVKLGGGTLCHSHALVADGVHSLSDLLTDAMVLFASKYGSQDADKRHPYGHQRFETAATLLLALVLILAGAGICFDAIVQLDEKTWGIPLWWALPIAIGSIITNEILFQYTQHIGGKIHSSLILANAWHHRSDAAASGVVALGLLGSLAGFFWLDTVAAIIVGIMIIKMGLTYGWKSVQELVDTSVEPDVLAQIVQTINHCDGVQKIHQLRSRLMGGDILIDVHILVSPVISVSEGHFIAQNVHKALVNQLKRVKDVMVHVDPEDDEVTCPSLYLPSRKTLEESVLFHWKEQFPYIENWTLHYLDGKLLVDLILEDTADKTEALCTQMNKDLTEFPDVSIVRLLQKKKVISMHAFPGK